MNSLGNHPHPHAADADSSSAASTPRAAAAAGAGGVGAHIPHHPPPPPPSRWHPDDPSAPLVRLMCSYGGRILPRPHDNQLRYVGGETRIVAVPRSASFSALLSRLSKLLPSAAAAGGSQSHCLRYQLPHEDLDALVSLTSDEDVENMFDEYDRLAPAGGRAPRLRLFLFPPTSASFGSIVDSPGPTCDQWFVDALNSHGSGAASAPPSLERGRSEASSIMSDVPDYLFGLDTNSDEPPVKPKAQPASPEPGSPFSSSPQRSVPPIPDLPPVKTKPEVEETRSVPVEQVAHPQTGLVANPGWSHVPQPVPIFCMPAPVHGGSLSMQQVPMPVQYVHSHGPMPGGQVPLWFQPQIQGGPSYVGGPPIALPVAVGGGCEHQVGAEAEAYQVPGSVMMPVYQKTGIPVAGEAVVAVPEMRAPRPAQ